MVAAQPFLKAELFIICRKEFTEFLNKTVFKKFGYNGTNSYTPKIFTCQILFPFLMFFVFQLLLPTVFFFLTFDN